MVCVSCPWCTDALLTAGRESSTPTSLCLGNRQPRIPFIVFTASGFLLFSMFPALTSSVALLSMYEAAGTD